MILGNVCTRPCGFCSVPKGKTEALQADEPARVAEAAARLGLKHVVITSVTRDDLADGGPIISINACMSGSGPGRRSKCSRPISWASRGDRPRDRARPRRLQSQSRNVPRLYHRVRRNAVYQRESRSLGAGQEAGPANPDQERPDARAWARRRTKSWPYAPTSRPSAARCSRSASTCSRRRIICPSNATCRPKNLMRGQISFAARFQTGGQRPVCPLELSRGRNGKGGSKDEG